jgi:hypothetical protein
MGLSRDAAGATSRALAVTFLAALRLAAVGATIDVVSASAGAIAEALEDALQVPVAPELAAVFPRISLRSAERLVAMLLAHRDAAQQKSDFDDDWFRNPRGLLRLRELDATPRAPKLADDDWRGGVEPLVRALEAMAG